MADFRLGFQLVLVFPMPGFENFAAWFARKRRCLRKLGG